MPNREIISHTAAVLLAATATSASAFTSASVDLSGYDACSFHLHAGATAPAGGTLAVEESDDNSTFTAAPSTSVKMIGATDIAANKTLRVAYVGTKRYARVVFTPNGSTILTISAVLGLPAIKPPANPV